MSEVAYAVAVREPEGLFLVVSIVRPVTGDVYVNWPRDGVPGWKPHTSYHASGQHHHKAFGKIGLKRTSTPPNADFSGEKNVVTMAVSPGDHRAVNVPCVESDYAEVFEVPSSQLTEHTLLSIDLVEVGGRAIITPESHVHQTRVFDDAVPWIIVTLFDTSILA